MECIDLGLIGEMVPIGCLEAIQKIPNYCMTCEIHSQKAELLCIKIDKFVDIIKSHSFVWNYLEARVEEF